MDIEEIKIELPNKIYAYLRYFVEIQNFATDESAFINMLINNFITCKHDTLTQFDSWKELVKRIDEISEDEIENIINDI